MKLDLGVECRVLLNWNSIVMKMRTMLTLGFTPVYNASTRQLVTAPSPLPRLLLSTLEDASRSSLPRGAAEKRDGAVREGEATGEFQGC